MIRIQMIRQNSWFLSRNIFSALLWRFLIIMFLMMLSRVGFYIFNIRMFPGMTISEFLNIIRGGVVFDLSAAAYFNVLVILLHIVPFDIRYNKIYEQIVKYLYFFINGLLLSLNGADYVYFRFNSKRAAADAFGMFRNEDNLVKLFFRFLADYWPATIFTLLLIGLMVYLYNKVKPVKPEPKHKPGYFALNCIMFLLVSTLFIGASRGGFRHSTRPITISNAPRYVNKVQNIPLVLNTPFSILKTFGKEVLTRHVYFDEVQLKALYNPRYVPDGKEQFRPLNVVVIIVESLNTEFVGFLNKDREGGTYQGFTPFLDSLLQESLFFEVSIENGTRSIDAMPSILASIPSIQTPYVLSAYANNTIDGLPSLLKKKGYYTAFFHGAKNGSMGFDSFARLSGFDDYYGLNEYPQKGDYDGMWGIWDEPFLRFFAAKLDGFHQPFMASVYTLSSHHPFKVPEKYEGRFKKGPIPLCETVGYTDFALRKFFDEAKTRPWFDNTLFVLTADHSNEKVYPEYFNILGGFSVPILFYRSGSDLKGSKNKIAQQIDILPSVLKYLNYDEEFFSFGNNLFDDSRETFAFNFYDGCHYLFMRSHVIQMVDNKTVALYNYKTDRQGELNLADQVPDLQPLMEEKLRAIIQTYNQSLLDNKMSVK